MQAARPPRRKRERRRTVDAPLNVRLVRVAAIAVVPAVLAVLFSVSTTAPLPRVPLEPLFDQDSAVSYAEQLTIEHPARVPGTLEAMAAANWYEQTVSGLGLATSTETWTEDIPDLGVTDLVNVVSVIPGRSEEAIVLVAHRDNAGGAGGPGDNASGTAALIELARGYAPQGSVAAPLPQRTLVLVSTDAGAYGGIGAARFARGSEHADRAIAVLLLDGLGRRGRPRLAIAGERPSSPTRALLSTASARIADETGRAPALPSIATQLVDLAIPFAAGEQGPFLGREIAAVTITTSEENGSALPGGDSATSLAEQRLGQLGRATEAIVGSIDISVGRAFGTPDAVFFGDRVASGWTIRLLLAAAVAPFALGVLDLVARGRRHRLPFAPALRALRARATFWLFAGLLLWLAGVAAILPTGVDAPLPSYASFLTDPEVAGVMLLALTLALGWVAGRRNLVPARRAEPAERLAGYTVALGALGVLAVVLAIARPYALVFVLPSLYAWLWLPLRSRFWTRVALFAVGLAGPIVGLLVLGNELGLGPLEAPLYVAGLATVGYVDVWSVLLALAWATAAAQLAALAFGRYAPYAGGAEPPPKGPVRTALARLARGRRLGRYSSSR
jgi:hypothetical protein